LSRPRVDGPNQCGGVNDIGDVPEQLYYFEEAMTWPAVLGLLLPDETLDESLVAYAVQSETVGALKSSLARNITVTVHLIIRERELGRQAH
jgi:hypothetical protein